MAWSNFTIALCFHFCAPYCEGDVSNSHVFYILLQVWFVLKQLICLHSQKKNCWTALKESKVIYLSMDLFNFTEALIPCICIPIHWLLDNFWKDPAVIFVCWDLHFSMIDWINESETKIGVITHVCPNWLSTCLIKVKVDIDARNLCFTDNFHVMHLCMNLDYAELLTHYFSVIVTMTILDICGIFFIFGAALNLRKLLTSCFCGYLWDWGFLPPKRDKQSILCKIDALQCS